MYDFESESPAQKLDRLVMNCEEMLEMIENTADEDEKAGMQEQYDDWAMQADKVMRQI